MSTSQKKNIMRILFLTYWLIFIIPFTRAQTDQDARFLKDIHDYALTKSGCYQWLWHLSTECSGRLAGSPQADRAVEYTKSIMDTLGFDTVWLQPCKVRQWFRGRAEEVSITSPQKIPLHATALGNSIGTGPQGVHGQVIEVQSLEDVENLGDEKIRGKIVFYNRPMDPTLLRTFKAYGGAVDQRVYGPSMAAKHGAIGVVVRSMTLRQDDVPHTGTLHYKDDAPKIPAVAISTNDADKLSKMLKNEKVEIELKTFCNPGDSVISYNVIGEIKGSEYPEEIIAVGGHLDCWDIADGAHDDGAGCVHSLEVIHTLIGLGYKPKRTLRCIMFMNEENGLAGGKEYAKISNKKNEYHLAALESDAGGFVPRAFSFAGHPDVIDPFYNRVSKWLPLMKPYGLYFTKEGSGADIGPLKSQKGLLIGLRPDSQRYFDYHHTSIDVMSAVNKRELELGAAAMTSLIYLIDKYGLK